jgi:membrane protein YqaA with SNARE-associated domain
MKYNGFLGNDFKIDIFERYSPLRLLIISMITAIFIIFPPERISVTKNKASEFKAWMVKDP